MSVLDTVKSSYGARAQSFRKDNPRETLKAIVKRHRGTDDELFEEARHRIMNNAAMMETVFAYWFTNNLRSLKDEARAPQKRAKAEETKAAVAAKAAEVKKAIVGKVAVILLDLSMPNGKALRDCTGADVRKAGGLFARIAERVKPNQIVGKVLTENDVKKLYA